VKENKKLIKQIENDVKEMNKENEKVVVERKLISY